MFDADGRVLGEYGASATAVIGETIWLSPQIAANDNQFGGGDGVGGYAPLAVGTGSGTGASLTWIHGNHLGVPSVFSNASGTAVAAPSYTLPGFPGQLKSLSDIYYNRYRDYDSSTGRYIQADPIGLGGGGNPFLYAGGNPLSIIDPLGLEEEYTYGHNSGDPRPLDRSDVNPALWNVLRKLLKIGAIPGAIIQDVLFPDSLHVDHGPPCRPADSPVWKKLRPYRNHIKTDGHGHYYTYERLHGEIEVFNASGRHLGVIGPRSGTPIKPAVPGRTEDGIR